MSIRNKVSALSNISWHLASNPGSSQWINLLTCIDQNNHVKQISQQEEVQRKEYKKGLTWEFSSDRHFCWMDSVRTRSPTASRLLRKSAYPPCCYYYYYYYLNLHSPPFFQCSSGTRFRLKRENYSTSRRWFPQKTGPEKDRRRR